jgi:Ni,Fe-hydrogenase III small subunit/formate hydrogenlyase subunit 6/NADH:ubiquinone oxidoreductase subunit I
MFDTIRQSLKTGVVTSRWPAVPPQLSPRARGRPEIDWANWRDARPAAAACPTGAISCVDTEGRRAARLDLAKCVFCGLCADASPQIRMTTRCQCAARRRDDLISAASYTLKPDGAHDRLLSTTPTEASAKAEIRNPQSAIRNSQSPPQDLSLESLGLELQARAAKRFGRSLHIRQVDTGSCNGCEIEIAGLNSPVYDIERFGIHFVASPRHADMLLVTGPVTRNMELALRKTYEATPAPRLVVAVGACGCSGGIFGQNYATCGAVDSVLPVDVYIPGCPPNPHALLHGILTAIGRMEPATFPG